MSFAERGSRRFCETLFLDPDDAAEQLKKAE
jgi:hypothetical protein